MAAVHQFVAGFRKGDAISNEALVFRGIFRSWGYDSDIFSESRRVPAELKKEARDVSDCQSSCRPDDIVLLHLSMGSMVNDIFPALPCKKAILFHNITPARYFTPVQKQIAHNAARGWSQTRALAGAARVTMADSRFNASELLKLGYMDVKVLPLILDLDRIRTGADRKTLKKFRDGMTNILFVGRCAPNKKIEDLLLAFSFFQKTVEPNSRFIHAGSFDGLERYYYILFAMTRELKLHNVHFTGTVDQTELNALYQCADIFLCMSEHEGFCAPVIESMAHNVPVMAYAAAAVPETLDGAGILVREKRFDMIAEMMGRLIRDRELRAAVLEKQRRRIERYLRRDLEAELRTHLSPLLGEPACENTR